MDRAERAVELKHTDCNCAQAVLLAFSDTLDLEDTKLRALGACFGCGMGAFDATCGALCAAQMLLGMKKYSGRPLMQASKKLHSGFGMLCGSTDCGELKGLKGGRMLCSCDDCIRHAVRLIEDTEKED